MKTQQREIAGQYHALAEKARKSNFSASWLGAPFGFLVRVARALGVAVTLALPGKLRGMGSSRKVWKEEGFLIALTAHGATLGFPLLIFFALLLGAPSTAQAVQINCSDAPYNGVIDGDLYPFPDNVKLDINCTIKNYPGGMSTNFSFDNNDPTPYLIIFDNVLHTGQMSCNTVAGHRIWFVNGSSSAIQEGCQNLLIAVEKIDKQSPAAFAAIGVPFTYTLTIPVLYDVGTGTVINSSGSVNELHSVILTDDLNATGADLTYLSHVAYWQGSGTPAPHTFSNVGGALTFDFSSLPTIPAGDQIVTEITVVLSDTPANAAGTVFTNTAKWSFGRLIDGVFYEPLPGEWGISAPMAIVEPDLVVTKTSSEAALNLGVFSTFTIDVQNTGGSDAWNTTILDLIPVGMCDYDPTTPPGVSAQIFAADGVTPVSGPLAQGTEYSTEPSGSVGLNVRDTEKSPVLRIPATAFMYQSLPSPPAQRKSRLTVSISPTVKRTWPPWDCRGAFDVRFKTPLDAFAP